MLGAGVWGCWLSGMGMGGVGGGLGEGLVVGGSGFMVMGVVVVLVVLGR